MLKQFVLLSSLLISLYATKASGVTAVVGTCKPGGYSTIQGAINAVPPGSTVLICPGTYNEQVTIPKPLTVRGLATTTSSLVTIEGQKTQVFSPFVGTNVDVQVLVSSTGPVTLSNITVDGSTVCSGNFFGNVYYASSSGTLDHLVLRNGVPGGSTTCGTGAWIENDTNSTLNVNLQNSSFYNLTGGVNAFSDSQPSALAVNTTRNTFAAPSGLGGAAMYYSQSTGTASGNISSGFQYGISLDKGAVTAISNNVIVGSTFGVHIASAGNTVTNNQFFNVEYVITLAGGANNNSVQQNRITTNNLGGGGANDTAISFDCGVTGNTVSANSISDKSIGLFFIPAGNSIANNTFFNVGTTATYCQ